MDPSAGPPDFARPQLPQPRFWCRDCRLCAGEACADRGHSLCSQRQLEVERQAADLLRDVRQDLVTQLDDLDYVLRSVEERGWLGRQLQPLRDANMLLTSGAHGDISFQAGNSSSFRWTGPLDCTMRLLVVQMLRQRKLIKMKSDAGSEYIGKDSDAGSEDIKQESDAGSVDVKMECVSEDATEDVKSAGSYTETPNSATTFSDGSMYGTPTARENLTRMWAEATILHQDQHLTQGCRSNERSAGESSAAGLVSEPLPTQHPEEITENPRPAFHPSNGPVVLDLSTSQKDDDLRHALTQLLNADLQHVREVRGLRCDAHQPLSLALLRTVAPRLECLEVDRATTDHMDLLPSMACLKRLQLSKAKGCNRSPLSLPLQLEAVKLTHVYNVDDLHELFKLPRLKRLTLHLTVGLKGVPGLPQTLEDVELVAPYVSQLESLLHIPLLKRLHLNCARKVPLCPTLPIGVESLTLCNPTNKHLRSVSDMDRLSELTLLQCRGKVPARLKTRQLTFLRFDCSVLPTVAPLLACASGLRSLEIDCTSEKKYSSHICGGLAEAAKIGGLTHLRYLHLRRPPCHRTMQCRLQIASIRKLWARTLLMTGPLDIKCSVCS